VPLQSRSRPPAATNQGARTHVCFVVVCNAALLESVRKMLDQQERNMASEAKQLASVGEYLRLRQEKLNLVETSFTNRGAGTNSNDMSYSAPVRAVPLLT
jgi:hypothetical protein